MTSVEENKTPEANGEASANTFKLPQWVQASLFEEVLQSTVPDYKDIQTFTAKQALSAGENYATIMLRIDIEANLKDGNTQQISYMLKLPHENEMYLEMLKLHNIFDVEEGMYLDNVPEMEQLYHDVGVEVKFGAQSYRLKTEKNNILLEDLKPKGFKNVNRLEGLDMEHTKCVLKKLAQWHAASAVRVETKGLYPEIYRYGFIQEQSRVMLDEMSKRMGSFFLESAKKYEGHELYLETLLKIQPDLTDAYLKVGIVDPLEFNVLNHGDCWANNIMFQYDEAGKVKETYLVDFQVPRYGAPAIDLYYFLLSSTHYDIKIKQFDYFIKFYHDQLTEYLQKLKYAKKIPTLKDLHVSLIKHGILGFLTTSGVMGAVLLDPNENANIENFIGDTEAGNEFKMLMYSNARFRKHAEIILPWLNNRGAFELN